MGRPPATSRIAYDDLVSPQDMAADARVVLDRVTGTDRPSTDRPPPTEPQPQSAASVDSDDRAVETHEVRVSEAAARMAGALHLHTD